MMPYTTEELFNNGARGKFGLYRNPWSPVHRLALTSNVNTAGTKPENLMSHHAACNPSSTSSSSLSAEFFNDNERRKRDELRNQNYLANIVGLENKLPLYQPISEGGQWYGIDPEYRTDLYSQSSISNDGHSDAGVDRRECGNASGSVMPSNDTGSPVNTNANTSPPVVVSASEEHGATGGGWETIHQSLLMVASGEWYANQPESEQGTDDAGRRETISSALLMVGASGEGGHANPVPQSVGGVPSDPAFIMTGASSGANQPHGEHGIDAPRCGAINPALLMASTSGGRHANQVHGEPRVGAAGYETINPALLMVGACEEGEGHANEVITVKDSSDESTEEVRLSKVSKGKWKADHESYSDQEWSSALPLVGEMWLSEGTGKPQEIDQLPSPPPISSVPALATSVQTWIQHNTPLLAEFAARQIHPPLGDRVSVELNEPTQFVTGMLQMLAGRDGNACNGELDHNKLSGCLLDDFVNLDRWAKEYFRGRFGMENIGNDIAVLLTIIANNFYEAHVRLVESISVRALENMRARNGSHLKVEDFSFGFDLHMAQNMPFFVEASHRVRDTLEAHRPKSPELLSLPLAHVSRYGRSSKLTKQAKATAKAELDKVNKARQKDRAAITAANALPEMSNSVQLHSHASVVTKGGKPSRVRGRGRRQSCSKPQPMSSTTKLEPQELASETGGSQLPTPAMTSGGSNTIRTPSAVVYHTPHYGQVSMGDVDAMTLDPSTRKTVPPAEPAMIPESQISCMSSLATGSSTSNTRDLGPISSNAPASAAANWTPGMTRQYLESISSVLPKAPQPSSRLKITIPKPKMLALQSSRSGNELGTGPPSDNNLSVSNVANPNREKEEAPPTRAAEIFHNLFKSASVALGSSSVATTPTVCTPATDVGSRSDDGTSTAALGSSGTVRGRSGSRNIVSTYRTRSRVAASAENDLAAKDTTGMGTRSKKRKLGA